MYLLLLQVIVERYYKETDLPILDKKKFLVPQEVTLSQFLQIIRNRMKLTPSKALFLLINNRTMISISRTVGEIYEEYKNQDSFLYGKFFFKSLNNPFRNPKIWLTKNTISNCIID